MVHSNKIVDRMSKNVEQLQWRIKNNFDLPVEKLTSQSMKSEDLILDELTSLSERRSSLPLLRYPQICSTIFYPSFCFRPQNQEEDFQCQASQSAERKKPTSLFLVSEEMMEATTTRSEQVSPSPDFTDSIEERGNNIDNEQKSILDHEEDLDLDVDSLDEGVGDVSSDGENQLSPVCEKSVTSSSSETVITTILPVSPTVSPVKERIPSRFSFSNK